MTTPGPACWPPVPALALPPVPLPSGPAAADAVAGRLSLTYTGDPPADVAAVVDAVNDWFTDQLGRTPKPNADATAWLPWQARYVEGCTLLACRLYTRRNSPAGVATFGAEGAVYVSRNDPDVAMMLAIGAYTKPRVG